MKPSQIIRRAALEKAPQCQFLIGGWITFPVAQLIISYMLSDDVAFWHMRQPVAVRRMFLLQVADALEWEGR